MMKAVVLVSALALMAGTAKAQDASERWVSGWGTAQQLAPMPVLKLPPNIKMPPAPPSPIPPFPAVLKDQTLRMMLRTAIGGRQVRVQISNATGSEPLAIGEARIARRSRGAEAVAGTDRALTFGGQAHVTVAPGSVIVSDPADLAVPALAELAVSLYVPGEHKTGTVHPLGLHTTYIAQGNKVAATALPGAASNKSYFWLADLDVLAPADAGVIVAFGDSITDGFQTTPDTYAAWPDVLASRLQAKPATARWSVVNAGISGNQLRRDGAGLSALARFDRDVLSRPGVAWVILLEGINDINLANMPGLEQAGPLTSAQLIETYRQFVARAHLHGIKVVGATITPTKGLWLYGAGTEALRQEVNAWIRGGGAFDAIVDFDRAVRDPADPARIKPDFDPGDHIHPNDAGNLAMAGAIDLSVFGNTHTGR